jgi:hypothetical protein
MKTTVSRTVQPLVELPDFILVKGRFRKQTKNLLLSQSDTPGPCKQNPLHAFFIHKKTSGNSRREDLYTPKIIQITSGSVKGLNQNDFSYLTRSFEICY